MNEIQITTEDLATRAHGTILNQWKDKTVFVDLINKLAKEFQFLLDTIHDVIKKRTLYSAEGWLVDVIGKIVGQKRELIDAGAYTWFAFDTPGKGFDQAPMWVSTAPLTGNYLAGDVDYKRLIEGKIYRNHIKYGSIPEIQEFIRKSFGVESSVELVDIMTVRIWVEDSTDDNTINFIGRYTANGIDSDRRYFIPLPAGYQISEVVRYHESVTFGGDSTLFDGSSVYW